MSELGMAYGKWIGKDITLLVGTGDKLTGTLVREDRFAVVLRVNGSEFQVPRRSVVLATGPA